MRLRRRSDMAKYRAGVIGLGWMGMLSDLAGADLGSV